MEKDHPSTFRILPWNGHSAALSLTFDDNTPFHSDYVPSELSKRSFRGTFFVIVHRLARPEKWSLLAAQGHEIGNQSWDHPHAAGLSRIEEYRQVAGAKERLEEVLGTRIQTFAYPFTEITPSLRGTVGDSHFLGRGGNRSDFYMTPASTVDWLDIPSQVALSKMTLLEYRSWVEQAVAQSAWTVLQFHGIEGDVTGWQPLPKATFEGILDMISEKKEQVWVAPFREIGAYWMAQKIVEKGLLDQGPGTGTISWKCPATFPQGVVLKAEIGSKSITIPFDPGSFTFPTD